MRRVLVAHASHFGRAHTIAEELCDCLRKRGYDVEVADAHAGRLPPPQDYDAVILGSTVHRGHHHKQIIDYIREHRAVLDQMPTGFFSISLAADLPLVHSRDPGGRLERMFRELGWRPDHMEAFGRLGVAEPHKLADLVAVSLAESAAGELSATYGPM